MHGERASGVYILTFKIIYNIIYTCSCRSEKYRMVVHPIISQTWSYRPAANIPVQSILFFPSVVEENSNRMVVLDSQCKSGEVAWRLSQTYVQLQINKPSSFRICFSSAAFPSLEKYGVYRITDGGMVFAGSPNRGIMYIFILKLL